MVGRLLFFAFIFAIFIFIFRVLGRFIAFMRGTTGRPHAGYQNQQRYNPPRKPETQGDRIIEYQKKTFSKDDAEDVEYEEIK